MKSLRQTLSLHLALGLLLSLMVQVALGFWALHWTAEGQVHNRLEHDAETLLMALQISTEGIPWLDNERLNPVFNRPFSGHYYRMEVAGLTFYSRSLWQESLKVAPTQAGEQLYKQSGPHQQQLLVLSQRFIRHKQPIVITVAEDLSALNQRIAQLSVIYGAVALLLASLLLAAQMLSLHLALQPLRQLMGELQALARGERKHLGEAVPTEIRPLVQTFNQLIGTLQQRHERTRNTMGNLAHAFKKPLTLMRQQLSALPSDQRQPLEQQLQRLQQLMEHELSRARVSGPVSGVSPFNLTLELPALVQLLQRMHGSRVIHCDWHVPEGFWLPLERQDALELLGNLLDNAFKWARSRVCVGVDSQQRLLIEDDGPGCEPHELQGLAQRGVRLDENTPGHGLGLAISREIMTSYQGDLVLGRSAELGGMSVALSFSDRASL
ncbi:MAG: sensor histidine kinase [Candidatus Sericytochromatia bacterium]